MSIKIEVPLDLDYCSQKSLKASVFRSIHKSLDRHPEYIIFLLTNDWDLVRLAAKEWMKGR
jgi:hypothetical protein